MKKPSSLKKILLCLIPIGLIIVLIQLTGKTTETYDLAKALPEQSSTTTPPQNYSPLPDFIHYISQRGNQSGVIKSIAENWHPSFTAMAVEIIAMGHADLDLLNLLSEKSGKNFGHDSNAWLDWLWNQDLTPHPDYPHFKSLLYQGIDPKFRNYFDNQRTSLIRLDEVRWGGVVQDGIPPLRKPKMIAANKATQLQDDNIIFGIQINGDTRAYPKRILAWHEMFTDTVGGQSVNGVYCTLCGSMILYDTIHEGKHYELGTSGFLYRSNKLMYDKETQSLWNTIQGKPVIGPLADKDIQLQRLSVVTTTWGEWKRRHPDTTVLSFDTGHRRNYGEGIAYQSYFATDDLMFTVPKLDTRLKNKAEILGLIFPEQTADTLALSADFLSQHSLHHDQLGEQFFIVVTDPSGANRVYESNGATFASYDGKNRLTDAQQRQWTLNEDHLRHKTLELKRLPAHRAFWFGWYSAYPDTRLVQ